MGIKAFNKEQSNMSTTQIIEDTLEVSADGSVSFRARRGKGSGRAVEISGDQFDNFVSMMNDIASRRESLAEKAKQVETGSEDVTDEVQEDSE